jgi:hypothetical protein
VALAQGPQFAAEIIRSNLKKRHDRVGHFVEVLLDRFADMKPTLERSAERSRGLVLALAETMDEVASSTRATFETGSDQIWSIATRLLDRDSVPFLIDAVAMSPSINWLAEVLRDQGAAHGRPEGREKDKQRQLLTTAELDSCISALTSRFSQAGPEVVFNKPSPLDILFCWLQLGSADNVRDFIAKAIQGDKMFLDAMFAMRGWSASSSEGIRHPLRRSYVGQFTDADEALARLQSLATGSESTLSTRASQLLLDWTVGD